MKNTLFVKNVCSLFTLARDKVLLFPVSDFVRNIFGATFKKEE